MSVQVRYEVDPIFGCHLWTGQLGNNGRPIIWRGRTPVAAHVVLWRESRGELPADRVLDHLCRRVLCVNVANNAHIEPTTKSENELRKSWSYRARRTHCSYGHELRTAMVTPEGGRVCRECNRVGVVALDRGGGHVPGSPTPGGMPRARPPVRTRVEAQTQFPPRKGR